jgi:hypothetical protein
MKIVLLCVFTVAEGASLGDASCSQPRGSDGANALEPRQQLAVIVQLLHVRVAADRRAADERVGHRALTGDVLERVLQIVAVRHLVQLDRLERDVQTLQQSLGLGAVRAVALAVHDHGRGRHLGLDGLTGAHHRYLLLVAWDLDVELGNELSTSLLDEDDIEGGDEKEGKETPGW